MDEVRVPAGEFDDALKRWHREGLFVLSVRRETPDDLESDWIATLERRTEIRDGI